MSECFDPEERGRLPKYLRLADHLSAQIESGALKSGDRLLSFAEVRARFGISQNTVEKAHALLERSGLIVRQQGRGTFVASRSNIERRSDRTVGLVTGNIGHPYYAELAAAIESAARGSRFSLWVNMHSRDALDKREALGRLDSKNLGALAIGPINDQKEWEFITHGKLPRHAMTFSCMSPIEASYVTVDRAAGIFAAMEYLHGLGHRSIALLTGEKKELVWGRLTGFRRALRNLGLNEQRCPVIDGPNPSAQEGGYEAVREILSWPGQTRPTALLMHNDVAAMGALQAARELGLKVPRDLSIVGFDDISMARNAAVPLTTIDLKTAEMGRIVIQILSELLDEEPGGPVALESHQIVLHPELVVRDSTDSPPAGTAWRQRQTKKGTRLVGS